MNYPQALYERAGEELDTARFSLAGGFPSAAVSQAYRAATFAARAALLPLGVSPKNHRAVIADFYTRFVEGGPFDVHVADALPRARALHEAATYEPFSETTPSEAGRLVGDVARFVEAVGVLLPDGSRQEPVPEAPDLPSLLPGHLASAVRGALAEASEALRALYGDRLRHLILYGSQARGDAHEESDVDVLVVLDGEVDAMAESRRVLDVHLAILDRHHVVLSLLPMAASTFEQPHHPLMMNVRREGVEV